MSDVIASAVIAVIAVIAGLVGLGLGILFLAPRLSRLANPPDEDTGDGDD